MDTNGKKYFLYSVGEMKAFALIRGNKGEFIMKKLIKLAGVIVFVAVIGLSFTACEDNAAKDDLDGTTWSFTEEDMTIIHVLTFSSPNFTWSQTYGVLTASITGTYSISDSTIILIIIMEGETSILTGTLFEDTLTFGEVVFTKQ